MSSLFKILFNLQIKSSGEPLEDYLTEIFAFCLNQDVMILVDFLKKFNIAEIDIEKDSLTTQYELKALQNHNTDSRPDMVFISKNTTIFFENKVGAIEGDHQLQRYAEHLDKSPSANKILVFITRDYAPKDKKEITKNCTNEIKFIQLRWYSIFRFLQGYKENPIAFELLKFMKLNDLAMNNQYSPVDILTMMNFTKVTKTMDETILGEISEIFEKTVGKKRTQDSARLTQLFNHDRYVYYVGYDNKILIFLGYWMNSDSEKDYPEVGIQMEISPASEVNSAIREVFNEISNKYEFWEASVLNDPRKWAMVYRKKSLQGFLSDEDQVESIKKFYKEALGELGTILSNYPDLKG